MTRKRVINMTKLIPIVVDISIARNAPAGITLAYLMIWFDGRLALIARICSKIFTAVAKLHSLRDARPSILGACSRAAKIKADPSPLCTRRSRALPGQTKAGSALSALRSDQIGRHVHPQHAWRFGRAVDWGTATISDILTHAQTLINNVCGSASCFLLIGIDWHGIYGMAPAAAHVRHTGWTAYHTYIVGKFCCYTRG